MENGVSIQISAPESPRPSQTLQIAGFAKWMRMAFPQVEIDIHLGKILGFV